MKIKDPFKNLKLDAFEQSIEDSFERGDFKTVEDPKMRQMFQEAARNTIAMREKKEARVNLRLKADTVLKLRNKASEFGMPYQTLASAVLHQFAIGKFKIKISM